MYGSMWVEEVSHWQKWEWGWFGGSEVGIGQLSAIFYTISTIQYYTKEYSTVEYYNTKYLFRRGVGAIPPNLIVCLFFSFLFLFVLLGMRSIWGWRCVVWGGDLRWGSICQFSRRHHLSISCHSFFSSIFSQTSPVNFMPQLFFVFVWSVFSQTLLINLKKEAILQTPPVNFLPQIYT